LISDGIPGFVACVVFIRASLIELLATLPADRAGEARAATLGPHREEFQRKQHHDLN